MSSRQATMLRKVPAVGLVFWLIKLGTTAMGESTSDFLVFHFNPYAAVVVGFLVFIATMWLQLRSTRYIPWVYWLNVLMVAIFGTMAADVTHVVLGIPYTVSTIAFAAVLTIIFYSWHRSEGTLSIHSITTQRREWFYWAAVLAAFALGTAAGDLFAFSFHLGFLTAGLVFAGAFLAIALAYLAFKWSPIVSFWLCYILTRPLGASFADWTGKTHTLGGLGWGDGPVAGVLFIIILILTAYLQMTHPDNDKSPIEEPVKSHQPRP